MPLNYIMRLVVSMKIMLGIAVLFNLVTAGFEMVSLIKLKRKIDIIKYYTYFQNALALIVSLVYSVFLCLNIIFDYIVPEYLKGLRYVTVVGLLMTSFVYIVFLSSKKSNQLSNEDFNNFNPKLANLMLHYLCPFISLVSFVVFEKSITLENGIWTTLAIIPTALYWILYLIFVTTKIWKEPYDFSLSSEKKRNKLLEVLQIISLPISFILISFVVWTIK